MSADIIPDKRVCRFSSGLADLQGLLEKQIESVRRSDLRNFEALTEQAGSIIDEIIKTKAFEQAEFKGQWERLVKLYKELILMVAARKEHVGMQVRRIREGKKTLEAYRGNG